MPSRIPPTTNTFSAPPPSMLGTTKNMKRVAPAPEEDVEEANTSKKIAMKKTADKSKTGGAAVTAAAKTAKAVAGGSRTNKSSAAAGATRKMTTKTSTSRLSGSKAASSARPSGKANASNGKSALAPKFSGGAPSSKEPRVKKANDKIRPAKNIKTSSKAAGTTAAGSSAGENHGKEAGKKTHAGRENSLIDEKTGKMTGSSSSTEEDQHAKNYFAQLSKIDFSSRSAATTTTVGSSTTNIININYPALQQQLVTWYEKHKRALPWRDWEKIKNDPSYKILVSEIMLQQTRVTAVIPYWEKWCTTWPSLQDLAEEKNMDRVLEHWAGLGYYNRARNLKKVAETVLQLQAAGGAKVGQASTRIQLPKTRAELQLLPGIGPYTASAVASIANGEKVGVVDGNVARVLHRLFHITGPMPSNLGKPGNFLSTKAAHLSGAPRASTKKTKAPLPNGDWLWEVMDNLTAAASLSSSAAASFSSSSSSMTKGAGCSTVIKNIPGAVNQAVMELGATVCTPDNPDCKNCPVQSHCRAFSTHGRSGKKPAGTLNSNPDIEAISLIGRKEKKKQVPEKNFDVVILFSREQSASKLASGQHQKENRTKMNKIAVIRESEGTLLLGQYRFPHLRFSSTATGSSKGGDCVSTSSKKQSSSTVKSGSSLFLKITEDKEPVKHVFSSQVHYYHIYAREVDENTKSVECCERNFEWKTVEELPKFLVSTGQNKIWQRFLKNEMISSC
ncbi:unnamed protein product [Amoebophrya sp. A120]|nr:unnamed protein product [Amoebophrya sp. A120]|eukprot:GSA120T00025719001.1